ncbi:MAG: hypothetical protein FWH48_09550 [Oscillospiraceae bacterium]|nr:hypothetical protein [Oscillospiraceae bacterium]
MERELSVRKNIRLKGYDYSKKGCYFLTICVKDKHEMLGRIDVGDGVLDVPFVKLSEYGEIDVGDGVPDVPLVKLSEYGEIAKKHIKEIVEHYKHISIQKYVIMPNHIHILLRISNNNDGTSNINDGTLNNNGGTSNINDGTSNINDGTSRTPSPTNAVVPSFVSTFKRFVHKDCGFSLNKS